MQPCGAVCVMALAEHEEPRVGLQLEHGIDELAVPQPAIEAAFRLLRGTGGHVGGVVLTQVDMKQQAKYGYGDPGYYYAEYKKYYVS